MTIPRSRRCAAVCTAVLLLIACPAVAGELIRAVTIRSTFTETRSNIQVPIDLNGALFDYSQANPDGSDVRFASRDGGGACPPPFDITYWIERWQPDGDSRIWVLVPTLPAGGEVTLYMFYGDPARNADDGSFERTFPRRFVVTRNTPLSGIIGVDWFEIAANGRVTLRPERPLTLSARHIQIDGVLDGSGAGKPGGRIDGERNGGGPGGGGGSVNAGGGGGGYGGRGGNGGSGTFGQTAGIGGGSYGATGELQLGSGGGASPQTAGGSGGGMIRLRAHTLRIGADGAVRADGQDGGNAGFGGTNGGGGGSGGGIELAAYELDIAGTLSAVGGDGSRGALTSATDDGGGGGGGRIRLYFDASIRVDGSAEVSGGEAGPSGFARDGDAGELRQRRVGRADARATLAAGAPCALVDELFGNGFEPESDGGG